MHPLLGVLYLECTISCNIVLGCLLVYYMVMWSSVQLYHGSKLSNSAVFHFVTGYLPQGDESTMYCCTQVFCTRKIL